MKLLSLAFAASFAVAGYASAQSAAQTPPPSESQPAPSSSSGHHPLSKSCREEVSKVCGTGHGKEMASCVKDNLDQNKFSADCTTELKKHALPPKPQA